MHSFFPLLGLLAVIPTIVSGKPVQSGKELRRLDRGIHKRQEVDGEDIETSGATDQLRKAVNYASVFSAQKTVTYSAVSTGAAPSDATLVGTVTRSPGSNAAGSPPDAKEQGKQFVVDHIVELQFVVGAFSIQSRPYVKSKMLMQLAQHAH
ncbi:MAG: hypothetical protein Q9206_004671 [Seirophora lacunosa]|nr:MAG: hypothetical protein LQ344_001955 [Seirophora lacunosa]